MVSGWLYDFASKVLGRRGKKIEVKTEPTPGSQKTVRVQCRIDLDVSIPEEFEIIDLEEPFSAAIDQYGFTIKLPYYMKVEESFLAAMEVTND